MKKFLLSLLVVALLAMTVAGAVSADDPTTYVFPYLDGETFTVPPGSDITLQWAWLATTHGLMNTFLRAWTAGYTIYDSDNNAVFALPAVQADPLWSPIEQINPADFGIQCASPRHWWSLWEQGDIVLDPGTYTLVTAWTQSRPVNDGWHTCVDAITGEPLAYPPSLYQPGSGTWTVTIVVE